jgi:hypothetical protein
VSRRTVLAPAALVALVWTAQIAAATPSLRRIALSPQQVGTGYRMNVIPGGTKVQGQATLDLCGFSYPSEHLRLERLQLAYDHTGKAVQLSNEVVRYRPGGAQQALREVAHAVTHCPRGPVESSVAGVPPLTYRIQKVTDSKLAPGYVAVRVHFSGTYQGKNVEATAVVVYQARGDVLTGVYTDGQRAIAGQLSVGLHAAGQSAANLRRFG